MNNILNRFSLLTFLSVLLVAVTGCLKDKYVEDGLAGPEIFTSPNVIELMGVPEGTDSYKSTSVLSFDIGAAEDTGTLVFVRLAANDPAPQDIQVELELDPSLLDAYNDSNHTHIEELPSNVYVTDPGNLVVTIPRGEREGALQIRAIPNNLLGADYALAFRIKSVLTPGYTISGNSNNTIVFVGVKNQFDGIYEVTGALVDFVNPALGGLYPMTVHLVTTGPSSVVMFDPDIFNDFIHPITNAGNPSGYGSYSPEFTFDAEGNVTSVVNYYGQPAPANGRSAALDPSGENKFDLDTKSMNVKYFLLQPGSTIRSTIDEHFTYVGPR